MRRSAEYDRLVRFLLAQDVLTGRGSEPVRLAPGRYDWAEARAEEERQERRRVRENNAAWRSAETVRPTRVAPDPNVSGSTRE